MRKLLACGLYSACCPRVSHSCVLALQVSDLLGNSAPTLSLFSFLCPLFLYGSVSTSSWYTSNEHSMHVLNQTSLKCRLKVVVLMLI